MINQSTRREARFLANELAVVIAFVLITFGLLAARLPNALVQSWLHSGFGSAGEEIPHKEVRPSSTEHRTATSVDEKSQWATFRDQGLGFEVQYPDGWHHYSIGPSNDSPRVVIFQKSDPRTAPEDPIAILISVWDDESVFTKSHNGLSPQQYFDDQMAKTNKKRDTGNAFVSSLIKVDGHEAVRELRASEPNAATEPYAGESVTLLLGNRIYNLSIAGTGYGDVLPQRVTFDYFVHSFHFIGSR